MTVRLRKDTGKWISDISYNGERIVTTLKLARTKKQAETAEAVIMNKLFQRAYGLEPKPDTIFENFVIETFLPYSEANKKSFVSDVSICKVLVRSFKGKALRQINPADVEAFKQQLLNTPTKHGNKRSQASVNNPLRVLSKILSLAVDAELIPSNPCFRVRKFRPNNRRLRVLSIEEEGRLFSQLKENDLLKRIILVALNTGLRRGEIFNLQWEDVDFSRDRLIVRKTKTSIERFVPINTTMRELLHSIRQQTGHVFPSPRTGRKLFDLKKSFRKAVDDAGIKNFRFHDLRHTFATRLSDNGVDVVVLQRILGHSDVRTTMIYTHAADEAMHIAVGKLNRKNEHFCNGSATETKTAGASQP
jgi:integrase